MATRADDDFELIRISMQRIRVDETPMCPVHSNNTLHVCLRSSAKCPDECPHKSDWIGPQP